MRDAMIEVLSGNISISVESLMPYFMLAAIPTCLAILFILADRFGNCQCEFCQTHRKKHIMPDAWKKIYDTLSKLKYDNVRCHYLFRVLQKDYTTSPRRLPPIHPDAVNCFLRLLKEPEYHKMIASYFADYIDGD